MKITKKQLKAKLADAWKDGFASAIDEVRNSFDNSNNSYDLSRLEMYFDFTSWETID